MRSSPSIFVALSAVGSIQLLHLPQSSAVAPSTENEDDKAIIHHDARHHLTLMSQRARARGYNKVQKRKKKKNNNKNKKNKKKPSRPKNRPRPAKKPPRTKPPTKGRPKPPPQHAQQTPTKPTKGNHKPTPSTSDDKPNPSPKPIKEKLKPNRKPVKNKSKPPNPIPTPPSPTEKKVYDILDAKGSLIDDTIFLYQGRTPSMVYRYEGFISGLRIMVEDGVAGGKYYLGADDAENGYLYGLVNVAAFIGQSMKETIQYDACDENNWDFFDTPAVYPLSNSCGQLEQSYADYHCPEHERHMECEVDKSMSLKATTHAKWYGAPGPFFCGPKSEYPEVGIWDYMYDCHNPWADPPVSCDVYEGQRAGRYDNSKPLANRNGRTDVEGCCWWGRGVIQTTGICNFGKLNYYLGARAEKEGRVSRYPKVDFCKDPGVICSSEEHKELKWIAGMFYWIESLQSYDERGFHYINELHKFVDGGMSDNSFIDGISGIVNRGCHDPPCGTGPVDGLHERASNFKQVLTLLTK